MWERVLRMLIKEFLQIAQDPRMKAVIFVTPVMQLLVFGYAVTTDVNRVTLAVVDLDRTPASRELARRFEGSGYFQVVARDGRLSEVLDRGRAKAAIQIDPGFAKALQRRSGARIQVLLDGTDSNTAGVVADYVNRIVGRFNAEQAAAAGVVIVPRAWYNPDLRSRDFYVPGVIAIIVMLTSLLLTSMAIVREREIGTLEQLMVTPIRPVELVLGKTLPFALIGFFNVALITTVAMLWFGIPMRGSFLLLFAATALYLMSTLGVGLFISTVSRTQQQALMSTFLFYLPAVLLSGFMFPIANMPQAVQWLTYLNPLRYFLVVIRGLFLKGVGPEALAPQMLALAALGAVILGLSVTRFHKTLE